MLELERCYSVRFLHLVTNDSLFVYFHTHIWVIANGISFLVVVVNGVPIYSHRKWNLDKTKFVLPCSAQIVKFAGPTWSPPRACRSQMGRILAPWTLISGCLWLRKLRDSSVDDKQPGIPRSLYRHCWCPHNARTKIIYSHCFNQNSRKYSVSKFKF